MVNLVLLPPLIAWIAILARARRTIPWLRSTWFAATLVVVTAVVDGGTIAVASSWRTQVPLSSVLILLWPTAFLSATTYLLLRARPDDGGRGDDGPESDPEPPWWPEFDRQFREYAGRTRTPPPPVRR